MMTQEQKFSFYAPFQILFPPFQDSCSVYIYKLPDDLPALITDPVSVIKELSGISSLQFIRDDLAVVDTSVCINVYNFFYLL